LFHAQDENANVFAKFKVKDAAFLVGLVNCIDYRFEKSATV
jgi:hypothetical protein